MVAGLQHQLSCRTVVKFQYNTTRQHHQLCTSSQRQSYCQQARSKLSRVCTCACGGPTQLHLERCTKLVLDLCLQRAVKQLTTVAVSVSLILTGCNAQASPSLADLKDLSYERATRNHQLRQQAKTKMESALPSSGEAEALLELNRDLFTPDAWLGMQRVVHYAMYVEAHKAAEDSPACAACKDNRLLLEKAWQVVANEFYDPRGTFSQADWAEALLKALQEQGGLLHTQRQAHTAASHMIASLGDKYSEFLTPTKFRKALRRPQPAERDYLAALANGVGVQVASRAREGGWLIDAALAESPAEEAGIAAGDRLLAIDEYNADDLTADEVAALLRGPLGSSLSLAILPASPAHPAVAAGGADGFGATGPPGGSGVPPPGQSLAAAATVVGRVRTVQLERRALPQPPLKQAVLDAGDGRRIGYLRLHYFCSAGTKALGDALVRGERDGLAGHIIDLRNNPGGVFEEAIAIASMLLPPGSLIASTVRNGDFIDASFRAGTLPAGMFPGLPSQISTRPIAVITNASSASASEVLAGALRDNRRATILGEKTFGKGVVQYYFPMQDGSGVKVTVAKYLTPNKYDITRQGGIQADVACHDYPHGGPLSADSDACIRQAVNALLKTSGGGPVPSVRKAWSNLQAAAMALPIESAPPVR